MNKTKSHFIKAVARISLKIFLSILALITFLLLVLGVGLYWAFEHPKQTYAYLEKHFFPEDLNIRWQDMQFSGKNLEGMNFEIDWTIEGLIIQKKSPFVDLPVDFIHFKAGVFPKAFPKVLVHELTLKTTQTLQLRLPPSAEEKPVQNPFQTAQQVFGAIETFQKYIKIENISLGVQKFVLLPDAESKAEPFQFSAQAVQSSENKNPDDLQWKFQTDILGKEVLHLKAEGGLELQKFQSEKNFLVGLISLRGQGIETEQRISVAHSDQTTWIKTQGRIDDRIKKLHLIARPQVSIKLTAKGADVQISGNMAGLPGPLVKVDDFKGEIHTPFDKGVMWSEKPSQFSMSAPLTVFFIDAAMRKPFEKSCQCRIPEVLLTEVSGKAYLSHLLSESADRRPALDAEIKIESVHNKLLSADVKASVEIEKQKKQFFYKPNLDGSIEVHSFQGLRKFLDAKNILVPAPFDVLDGTLLFVSKGPVETTDKGYVFPGNLKVNLASDRQKINLETSAQAHLNTELTEALVEVKARLADFQVVLPPLDPLKGKPRLAMDQRILKAPIVLKKSKFKLSLSFEVDTVQPGAIRLLSKYFVPNLPMTLKIQRNNNQANGGFVQTEPFDIVYLRRKVRVQKMKLDLSDSDTGIFPVDAQFKIQQTQYLITIDVKGTTEQPQIVMSSDPYLPESEIISVLIYDRLSTDLIAADAETAGGVQAAMADRAIGLFGLWAFAATPIKSFSYNPVTKVYTATVALADDVTAGIGTNWEASTRLELRKRVSRKWMLTAAWTQATAEEAQSTRLVLQWEQRF